MKSTNTIEINGNLYDAKTGLPLNRPSSTNVKKHTPVTPVKTVDGFRAAPKSKILVNTPPSPASQKSNKPTKKDQSVQKIRTSAPKASTKPKQSVTLHRRSVKKPNITAVSITHNDHKAQSTALKIAKSEREKRAMQIAKSSIITRFGQPKQSQTIIESTAESLPAEENTLTHHLENTHLSTPAQKQTASTTSGSVTKEQLIKQSVDKAVLDHKSKKINKKKPKKHFTKYASTFAVVLFVAGYVAYLNIPGISMKVAANRAGFSAALPGYTPGGYSLRTPISSAPGIVSIDFHANTDGRKFTLKQQPTTWDSAALLENFVTKKSKNYLTYQDRGLTIYIYEGSSAAWVNGGKMYSLEGSNSQLDTDQLLKLATSM